MILNGQAGLHQPATSRIVQQGVSEVALEGRFAPAWNQHDSAVRCLCAFPVRQ